MAALVVDPVLERASALSRRILVRGHEAWVVALSRDSEAHKAVERQLASVRVRVLIAHADAASWVGRFAPAWLERYPALFVLLATDDDALCGGGSLSRLVLTYSRDEDDVVREACALCLLDYIAQEEDTYPPDADLAQLKRLYAERLPARLEAIVGAVHEAARGAVPLDVARHLTHRMLGTASSYGYPALHARLRDLEARMEVAFARGAVSQADHAAFQALASGLWQAL